MSLTTPKTFKIAIIASKALDDPDFIPHLVGDKASSIEHIYTNGANKLVVDFAQDNGIPYTVFPLTNRSLPWSTAKILDEVKIVYLISTPDSHGTMKIYNECEKKGVKVKVIPYEPYAHWQEKIDCVTKIISSLSEEEIEANPTLKSIRKLV